MNLQFFKNKYFVFGGGFAVLLVLGVVLGLTIVRIQNPQSTVTQPKAAGITWPGCTQTGSSYRYEGDLGYLQDCCSKVKTDPFACSWPARGWCKPPPDQCPDSGGQRCGLYFFNQGSGCYGYGQCIVGKAYNPSITNGQINVSTTPTLSWGYSPYPSGGTPYASVYLWSCAAKSDDCQVFASVNTTADNLADNVAITNFYKPTAKGANFQANWQTNPNYYVQSLKPNTQYWWTVTPGVSGCGVQTYADTWTFTTGASGRPTYCSSATINSTTLSTGGSVTITGTSNTPVPTFIYAFYNLDNLYGPGNPKPVAFTGTDCVGKGWDTNGLSVSHNVSARATDSLTVTSSLVDCVDQNTGSKPTRLQVNVYYTDASGNTSVPDAQCVVQFTTKSAAVTHLGCVDLVCATISGAGANTEGCQTEGTACSGGTCTSNAGCPSGQTCVGGTCTGSTQSHFECVNKTCASVSGSGSNKNGCTAAGGSCCASDSDCSSGQTCNSTTTPNSCTTTSTNQVNTCWGNGGGNGKCYDCNGDGEVNILDFACFRAAYLKNVQ